MHSGTVPETFRNTNVDHKGTNEDDSQSDPHLEAGLFRSQTTQNSGQEVGPYTLVTGSRDCRYLLIELKKLHLWDPISPVSLIQLTSTDNHGFRLHEKCPPTRRI